MRLGTVLSTSSTLHTRVRSLTPASPPFRMTSRFVALYPELLPYDFQNLLMRLPGRPPRIHHDDSSRLPLGDCRESLAHPPKKGPRLALKTVFVVPAR